MASVKRSMLNTTSRFFVRAQVRMFSASVRFFAKIVEAMPNWKFAWVFASACIASIVFDALSKPFLTVRTWSCTSPMPSSETRMLIRIPFSAQNSTMRVSIGMARLRRQARRVDPDLAQPGQVPLEQLDHLGQVDARGRLAAGDVQVLDRAPERDARTGSSSASVMSDLRSPHFQLLHIVHRASQTQVQL